MKKITKIDTIVQQSKKKIRVAAYARVSTSSADQLQSLAAQKSHYERVIKSNDEWEFVDLYYDEGISGTKASNRLGLKRLIYDCEMGKIDFILTKSISRFARNTVDCLELVRKLLNLNVSIEFEKEGINTSTMDGEMMLTLLSGIAEDESKSISNNIRWSVERRYQNGSYKPSSVPFGYDWIDEKMVVNEAEAEIVKEIFSNFINGIGTAKIANKLNQRGIKTKRNGKWQSSTVAGMLRNEKYTGHLLFGKTFTDELYRRRTNNGERNQYLLQNNHEAIITEQDFKIAAEILALNASSRNIQKGSEKYQRRYSFSGLIKCDECGGVLRRKTNAKNPNEKYTAWLCVNRSSKADGCSLKFLRDEDIKVAFTTMINKLIFAKKEIFEPLVMQSKNQNLDTNETAITKVEAEILDVTNKMQTLNEFLIAGMIDIAVFTKDIGILSQTLNELNEDKEHLRKASLTTSNEIDELFELYKFIKISQMLDEFDDDLFKRIVTKISVQSRTKITFHLKCGLNLEEGLV